MLAHFIPAIILDISNYILFYRREDWDIEILSFPSSYSWINYGAGSGWEKSLIYLSEEPVWVAHRIWEWVKEVISCNTSSSSTIQFILVAWHFSKNC